MTKNMSQTKTCHDCFHKNVCAWWYEYESCVDFGYDLQRDCPYFAEVTKEWLQKKAEEEQ